MAYIHGRGGVPAYWIINLVDRQVELHTAPSSGGYRSRQVLNPGDDVAVVVDGAELDRLAVADIMRRRP
jgi:Uma2 family endonuclease